MKNLGVRIVLMLLAVAAVGAGGFELWRIERTKQEIADGGRQADERIRRLMLAVTDLRAQQQAYVAAGQGTDFWAKKVTQVLAAFDRQVAEVRPTLRSADAQTALDSATGALDTFRKMDARAREYAGGRQELLASDLIFTDGFETTASALSQLDAVRAAETVRADAEVSNLQRAEVLWAGGSAALCLLVILTLTPRPKPRIETVEVPVVQPAAPAVHDFSDALVSKEPARAETTPDLTAAADVCAGLARVLESSELTVLLGRVAQVMNAAGVIVWVADRSGAELRPALAHGYPPQTLRRMGTIPRDGHNAVAAAYRSGVTRIVVGDGRANGAVVAPIVSPGGCLGVLAAEVRRGGEQSTAIKALAMVFASQLGTLVGSVPAEPAMAPVQSLASST
jgi:hypothetical protein